MGIEGKSRGNDERSIDKKKVIPAALAAAIGLNAATPSEASAALPTHDENRDTVESFQPQSPDTIDIGQIIDQASRGETVTLESSSFAPEDAEVEVAANSNIRGEVAALGERALIRAAIDHALNDSFKVAIFFPESQRGSFTQGQAIELLYKTLQPKLNDKYGIDAEGEAYLKKRIEEEVTKVSGWKGEQAPNLPEWVERITIPETNDSKKRIEFADALEDLPLVNAVPEDKKEVARAAISNAKLFLKHGNSQLGDIHWDKMVAALQFLQK